MTAENQPCMTPKELATRWFEEIWNAKNPDLIRQWMAPDAVGITEGGEIHGPDDFHKLVYEPLVQAFPDFRVECEAIVAEGEDVMTRWVVTARHLGPFMDLAPTGKSLRFHGMTWLRVRNGKVIGGADSFNLHGIMNFLASGTPTTSVTPAGMPP